MNVGDCYLTRCLFCEKMEVEQLYEKGHQHTTHKEPTFPRNTSKQGRKRHGARNQHRHKHFARWLEERFSFRKGGEGGDSNYEQTHILEVAGGKGVLAARLCMCLRQRVILVDPREADPAHAFETLVLRQIPKKWQQRLEGQRAENPNFVQEKINERFRQLVTTFDEDSLQNSSEIQKAVEGATLMIGFHADEATEIIVDVALKHQKPFVVVPCCVFPSFFPQRYLVMEDGCRKVPVQTHEQFCQYLFQKHPGIRMETLPFEGRNVAIWWDGRSVTRSHEPCCRENDSRSEN